MQQRDINSCQTSCNCWIFSQSCGCGKRKALGMKTLKCLRMAKWRQFAKEHWTKNHMSQNYLSKSFNIIELACFNLSWNPRQYKILRYTSLSFPRAFLFFSPLWKASSKLKVSSCCPAVVRAEASSCDQQIAGLETPENKCVLRGLIKHGYLFLGHPFQMSHLSCPHGFRIIQLKTTTYLIAFSMF